MLFLTDWFPASLCRNVLPPALPLTTCPGYTHGEYNCSVFPKCHIKPARLKGFVELSENILLRASTALQFSWDYSVFVSATKHTQKGLINLLNKCQRSYSHKLQQKKKNPWLQAHRSRHQRPWVHKSYKLSELDLLISQAGGLTPRHRSSPKTSEWCIPFPLSCKATHEAEEAFPADAFGFMAGEV